ncbi:hypothetical protein COT72_03310 [archaeon CG10_big_fil_rev_8_21_14_0_10_43_11]|nr:MAG: hypothetical protein COT72_03310 [archaeon CG10_big_fil_rev_8_21_14_0_10_43_11]
MTKKGFTFSQIAAILLVIFVLLALILLFITQRDQIGAMLERMIGIGNSSLNEAESQLEDRLGIGVPTQSSAYSQPFVFAPRLVLI